ncbi:MAG: hypothetical protein JXB36_05060 [Gammaproteobacteria bacterium]|nr:hypothetical protein [Gammaproteobacteria bacterium]
MNRTTARAALLALSALLTGYVLAQQNAPRPQEAARDAEEPVSRSAEATVEDESSVELIELLARVAAAENRQFVVDPRVRGRARIVPPVETPSYELLLSILRVHGYAAVGDGGTVSVVPDGIARTLPTRVVQSDDDTIPKDELVSRVIAVGSNAPQLVPVLRPLLPQYAHLAATSDGRLVVVDYYDNVRRISELARALGR